MTPKPTKPPRPPAAHDVPDILAERMRATAAEIERELHRLVSHAIRGVADTVRPLVTKEPPTQTETAVAALPESVRRIALDATAPLFQLFGDHAPGLLAHLDALADDFASRAAVRR